MKFFFNLTLLMLIIASTGCITQWKKDDPFGRTLPKRPNWSLASEDPANPEEKICTKSIYVNEYFDPRFGKYEVFRFFENGRFMGQMTNDYSDVTIMNTFQNASVGYFRVKGNKITFESFARINNGQYGYSGGEMLENGDYVNYFFGPDLTRGRNWLKEPALFRKISIEGLKPLEPDW